MGNKVLWGAGVAFMENTMKKTKHLHTVISGTSFHYEGELSH